MDIRFISSLTADDEARFAAALLSAIAELLDRLPITYSVRIETTGGQSLQHANAPLEAAAFGDAPVAVAAGASVSGRGRSEQ